LVSFFVVVVFLLVGKSLLLGLFLKKIRSRTFILPRNFFFFCHYLKKLLLEKNNKKKNFLIIRISQKIKKSYFEHNKSEIKKI